MIQAKAPDLVRRHYPRTPDDRMRFDGSRGGIPIEFSLERAQLVRRLDPARERIQFNKRRQVAIALQDTCGPRFDDLELEVAKTTLPGGLSPW